MTTTTHDADRGTITVEPTEQLELDLGIPAEQPAPPSASNPVPIGLQDLMDLGVRVEALGKAMQDPTTDMRELVRLSHACGLDMHIEILPPTEQPADPSVPATGDTAGDGA